MLVTGIPTCCNPVIERLTGFIVFRVRIIHDTNIRIIWIGPRREAMIIFSGIKKGAQTSTFLFRLVVLEKRDEVRDTKYASGHFVPRNSSLVPCTFLVQCDADTSTGLNINRDSSSIQLAVHTVVVFIAVEVAHVIDVDMVATQFEVDTFIRW